MLLSIIIPAYNESASIEYIIDKAYSAPLPPGIEREIIVVDDASTDETYACAENYAAFYKNIHVLRQKRNKGKGAAVRLGISESQGDYILIQDADREYPSSNYMRMMSEILEAGIDAVYGVRTLHSFHKAGNRLLTYLSNRATGYSLKDMETGHKLFRAALLKSLRLRSSRFAFEAEVTAKLADRGAVIREVPIEYFPRTRQQGKKIGWRDAAACVWTIARCGFAALTPAKRCCIALLCVQALLLAYLAGNMSLNRTEVGYLGSAVYFSDTHKLDVFHVNAPLTRMITAFPASALDYDRRSYSPRAADRCEWGLGKSVIASNPQEKLRNAVFWMRLSLIPLILFGGYCGYRFANELYGGSCGLVFLTLWTFSPLVLGWGASLCSDAAAAAMGIAGLYFFRRWLVKPTHYRGLTAGIVMGLMCLTKLTWLLAFPLYLLLWLVCSRKQSAQFAMILLTGLAVLNAGYFYEGSLKTIGGYSFRSNTMKNTAAVLAEQLPVPLPRELVMGIDTQSVDFEKGTESYLNGVWSDRGWKHYYLCVLAYKEPVGVIMLFLLAAVTFLIGRKKGEGFIVISFLFVFTAVSSVDGLSAHPRYILPALPLLYLFCCRLQTLQGKAAAFVIPACLGTMMTSSLTAYPHSLSYFNECFTAHQESEYLLGSNIDHGQDCYELQRWIDRHIEGHGGTIAASVYAAEPLNVPKVPEKKQDGWMIISVNELRRSDKKYDWLKEYKPAARIGRSIEIYHLAN
ncbi:MAG: glycosyltransferase family 2 protein [Planctomycetaceae bacterium]|jgi:hypothetical protein|nr:glycosyltransferase family 2 protein [Planctomycetaceae bacterium]